MEKNKNFQNWKKQIETFCYSKQIDLLRTVELNLSNVCNLKCKFCPQGHQWISKKPNFMKLDVVDEVCKQLKDINFNGYICIAGHGEPSLHPNIQQILNMLEDFNITLITNGLPNIDWKNAAVKRNVNIKVSMHDTKDLPMIEYNMKNIRYELRNHTVDSQEMFKNNRAGFFSDDNSQYRDVKCYYPFYETFIDTDGSYKLCASQWIKGFAYTVFDVPIYQHFLYNMQEIKTKMAKENRSLIEECKQCNSYGTIVGENIFNIWKNTNLK